MKPIITITAENKETMGAVVRRAMANADCNNNSVVLEYKNVRVEVIPNDKPNRIFRIITVQTLVDKIRKLELSMVKIPA